MPGVNARMMVSCKTIFRAYSDMTPDFAERY